MGGTVGKDTKVTKEQALSAVADAFGSTPRAGVVSVEDIVNAASASAKIRPTRLDRWTTASVDMQAWTLKASNTLGKAYNSPRVTNDNPFLSGGRLLAGSLHSDTKLLSTTTLQPNISWKAALDASATSRDKRLAKVRVMFDALDLDDCRDVAEDEFVAALAEENIIKKDAARLFRSMDDSSTGRLTLAKFDHCVAVHTLAIVRDSFKCLDASSHRQIQRSDFAMYFMGNGLSKPQAARLWQEIDRKGSGKINFTEYRDWAAEVLEGSSLPAVAVSLGLSSTS